MSKRDRDRRPVRQHVFREPKPLILIVTEGEVTEPEYLEGFRTACRNPRVRINVQGGKGVPKTLVEFAKELKKEAERQAKSQEDENLRYDEVWCVFDVDEHPKVDEAKVMARGNSIKLAISNPCIELWLLLHFEEKPGNRDRHALRKRMKKHIKDYDKHVVYSDYEKGYELATKSARRLDPGEEHEQNHEREPSTGMWRLTESIRLGS